MSDLLFAELAKANDLKLVERIELEAIAQELKYSVFSSNALPSQRVKLGQLVSADLLFIVSRETTNKQQRLCLTVSDTRHGARIRTRLFDDSKPAEAAAKCAAECRRAANRFKGGIHQVIGVSPFISKDLTHDYDYLQSAICTLLQNALGASPGVAVIEMEEAVAIRKELLFAGKRRVERTVPLLVEGSFTTSRKDGSVLLQISTQVHAEGARLRTIKTPPMTFAKAAEYVAKDLPKALLAKANGHFDPKLQRKWLLERASEFSLFGVWNESARLREAALLLQTDDRNLRLLLIATYQRLVRRPLYEIRDIGWQPEHPLVRKAIRKRVDAYLAGLAHLAYLIRSSKINAWPAVKLADSFRSESLVHAVPRFVVNIKGVDQRIGQGELQRAVLAERRFFFRTYPRILGLKNPGRRTNSILNDWQPVLFKAICSPVDRVAIESTDLNHIAQAIEIVPDGGKASPLLEQLLRHGSRLRDMPAGAAYSKKQWEAFVARLLKSKRAMGRIYGRYGLVWFGWYDKMRNGLDALPVLITQVDHLLEDFGKLPYRTGIVGERQRETLALQLRILRADLARTLEQIREAVRSAHTGQPPRPPRVYEPLRAFPMRTKIRPSKKRLASVNKLVFTPIRLRGVVRGRVVPIKSLNLPNLCACSKGLDVLWSGRELAFMQGKIIRRIFREPGITFTDVQWDGANIWAATREKGILIVSPQGVINRKIADAQGLPPSNRGMLLHVLRQGWVCAVGSFGEHERGWCAIVTAAGQKVTVNVFHQAKQVTNAVGMGRLGGNAKLVFQPTWLHAFDGGGGPGYLLVGRKNSYGTARYPLMIELKTFKAWVHFRDFEASERLSSNAFFSGDGELLVSSRNDVCQWGGFAMDEPVIIAPEGKKFAGCLLEYNDWLYAPGAVWYRLKPGKSQIELLANDLPTEHEFSSYAVSANHGLIGWRNDGVMCRIRVK